MNEEILRIQKMVAEGKITPEEGAELVESVRSGGAAEGEIPAVAPAPLVPQGAWALICFLLAPAWVLVLPAIAWFFCPSAFSSNPFLAFIVIVPCLLTVAALILGLISWCTKPGKAAAIGVFVEVGVIVLTLLICFVAKHLF